MALINKQDTNGVTGLLDTGEFGFDNYVAGGDQGRVYVGDGTSNNALGFKSEVDLKAPIASPTFTGVPAVPTATPGADTTQAASTEFVQQELAGVSGGTGAVAWINFDGDTHIIRASDNVTSITDGGTGKHTITMTNALADTSYAIIAQSSPDSSAVAYTAIQPYDYNTPRTTTAFKIDVTNAGGAGYDSQHIEIAVFR